MLSSTTYFRILHPLQRTSVAIDFFVEKFGNNSRVILHYRTSFRPSRQIVPSKNSILISPQNFRHEYNVYTDLFPYSARKCWMKRFFLPNPGPSLAFSARLYMSEYVIIHTFPLVPPGDILVSGAKSTMAILVVKDSNSFCALMPTPKDPF